MTAGVLQYRDYTEVGLHYDEMFDDDRLSEGGIGECE